MSLELSSWGSQGYPTKLRLKTFKGRRFLDVRKYFKDQPTRKGIALRAEQYGSLLESLLVHGEEIAEWFTGEGPEVVERLEKLQEQLRVARQREAKRLHRTDVTTAATPGNSLFSIEFRGSDALVRLNEKHRHVRALDRAVAEGNSDAARHLLGRVLQASFHAVGLASTDGRPDLGAAEEHAHLMALLLSKPDEG